MANDPSNPFGGFEEDFKDVVGAPPSLPGRIPEGVYKFVLTAKDVDGKGTLADHDAFIANSGTPGFKVFAEVLEPETAPNPNTKEPQKTKGEIVELVWWVTAKTIQRICWEMSTIQGRDVVGRDISSNAISKMQWAGRTFEGVVRDETDKQGYTKSRIGIINKWSPTAAKGTDPKAETKKTESAAKGAAPKGTQQAAGAAKAGGKATDVDF